MKKALKIFGVLAVFTVVVLLCTGLWLRSGKLTPARVKVFQVTRYPLALVSGRPVLMKDFILRLAVAEKMQGASPNTKTQVYNQLIDEEKIRQVALDKNVSVSPKEVETSYQEASSQPGFFELLGSYGINEADFKAQIIKPRLLLVNLQIWFNSQRVLNQNAYSLADTLETRLKNGEDMSALAKDFTQDSSGKLTGGDLGFVDPASLLAELKEPVANMKNGEVKVLPSRLGLHIIKNEGQSENRQHLRQIFLKTGDFNSWLDREKKTFKIWQLVKI